MYTSKRCIAINRLYYFIKLLLNRIIRVVCIAIRGGVTVFIVRQDFSGQISGRMRESALEI